MKEIPGFIDLQVNGHIKIDYSDAELNEEDFIRSCDTLLAEGTAAFLPTVITSHEDTYRAVLPKLGKFIKSGKYAGKVLGLHIEGPFISPVSGARGAHNPDFICRPDVDYFKRMIEWSDDTIKILTVAPEVPGAVELTEFAVSQGIVVSMGHHLGSVEDVKRLTDAGAKLLTHLGNGTPNEINRFSNPIWAGLAEDRLIAMIITDGHHLPDPVIKTFVRTKGIDNIIVTSDASPLAGCPPGVYKALGNKAVLEENGYLHNPDIGYMVGSSATMIKCVNHLAGLNLVSPEDLIKVGFDNPLKLIGVDPSELTAETRIKYDPAANRFSY